MLVDGNAVEVWTSCCANNAPSISFLMRKIHMKTAAASHNCTLGSLSSAYRRTFSPQRANVRRFATRVDAGAQWRQAPSFDLQGHAMPMNWADLPRLQGGRGRSRACTYPVRLSKDIRESSAAETGTRTQFDSKFCSP
jgi:hypothetical protein